MENPEIDVNKWWIFKDLALKDREKTFNSAETTYLYRRQIFKQNPTSYH